MNTRRYMVSSMLMILSSVFFSCSSLKQPPSNSHTAKQTLAPVAFASTRTVNECTRIDETVSFRIERGKDGCIENLISFGNTECKGQGDGIVERSKHPILLPSDVLSIGPLVNTNLCSEILLIRQGSPCRLYESGSGGDVRKICYHGSVKRPLEECLNHTGQCADHNPH